MPALELYDPATGTWTGTGAPGAPRGFHTATLLPNGKVLIAGGYNLSGGFLSSAELYDPATGTWTPTGGLETGREYHTATLLPNGMVLVAGGENGQPPHIASLASAELYDPTSGAWTATGGLNLGRYQHTATLLPNGLVLAAGGYGNFGLPASAELYDPGSGTWTTTGAMNTARYEHTATLLPDGTVLAAGGLVHRRRRSFERGGVQPGDRGVDGGRRAENRPRGSHGDLAAQWNGTGRRGL